MKTVSWMTDYIPVSLLSQAQRAERRFEECLKSCPTEGDTIKVDDPAVFARLLDERLTSLCLSMAALESFLGLWARQTAEGISEDLHKLTLFKFFEAEHIDGIFKEFPNRLKRRHQMLMEENGEKPVRHFLTSAEMTLEEKLIYWTLIRTGKLLNFKEGYIKKFMRVYWLWKEVLQLNIDHAPELRKVKNAADVRNVFLHHELPDSLTLGKSASDEYVIETYLENHFLWEILHIYPARLVQELVQYLYKQDNTDNHFITVTSQALLVDDQGAAVTEEVKKYVTIVDLEG